MHRMFQKQESVHNDKNIYQNLRIHKAVRWSSMVLILVHYSQWNKIYQLCSAPKSPSIIKPISNIMCRMLLLPKLFTVSPNILGVIPEFTLILDSLTKGYERGKYSHLVTSSCSIPLLDWVHEGTSSMIMSYRCSVFGQHIIVFTFAFNNYFSAF